MEWYRGEDKMGQSTFYFIPVAWDGHDRSHPDERTTNGDGQAEFAATPRGYCVYAPVFE